MKKKSIESLATLIRKTFHLDENSRKKSKIKKLKMTNKETIHNKTKNNLKQR
jgi:hypothetical protein